MGSETSPDGIEVDSNGLVYKNRKFDAINQSTSGLDVSGDISGNNIYAGTRLMVRNGGQANTIRTAEQWNFAVNVNLTMIQTTRINYHG